jgi:hypothetical protein
MITLRIQLSVLTCFQTHILLNFPPSWPMFGSRDAAHFMILPQTTVSSHSQYFVFHKGEDFTRRAEISESPVPYFKVNRSLAMYYCIVLCTVGNVSQKDFKELHLRCKIFVVSLLYFLYVSCKLFRYYFRPISLCYLKWKNNNMLYAIRQLEIKFTEKCELTFQ